MPFLNANSTVSLSISVHVQKVMALISIANIHLLLPGLFPLQIIYYLWFFSQHPTTAGLSLILLSLEFCLIPRVSTLNSYLLSCSSDSVLCPNRIDHSLSDSLHYIIKNPLRIYHDFSISVYPIKHFIS